MVKPIKSLDVLKLKKYDLEIKTQGLDKGQLIFFIDKGKTVPESINFKDGNTNLSIYTDISASKLKVNIHNKSGEKVGQQTIGLETTHNDIKINKIAAQSLGFLGFFLFNENGYWEYYDAICRYKCRG